MLPSCASGSLTMAVPQLSPAEALTARLEKLLERARNVKESTSIEPPLQATDLVGIGEDVVSFVSENKDVHYNAMETAAKKIFYAKIVGARYSHWA